MTPWLAAHLRLCARLPSRTHTRSYDDGYREQGRRIGKLPDGLVNDVRRMLSQGAPRTRIIHALRLGLATYQRILNIISAEHKE